MTFREREKKTEAHIEEESGRRAFLTKVIGFGSLAWVAAAAYPVVCYLNAPESDEELVTEVDLGDPARFKPGTVTAVAFGKKPAYLIADDRGEFSAVSAVCTHLGCTIRYEADSNGFHCPCHGGRYDLTGKNISGPPPRPLEKFGVEMRAGSLWMVRV